MPSCREYIGKQYKVRFMFGALRKFERVEICERHAKVLRLTTLVRAHRHVTIGTTCETWIHTEDSQDAL